MNKIIVVVKLWFDSVNGNTYHRVKLFFNNTILDSGVVYGYETQYIETARKVYKDSTPFDGNRSEFYALSEFEVINVNKKELYK